MACWIHQNEPPKRTEWHRGNCCMLGFQHTQTPQFCCCKCQTEPGTPPIESNSVRFHRARNLYSIRGGISGGHVFHLKFESAVLYGVQNDFGAASDQCPYCLGSYCHLQHRHICLAEDPKWNGLARSFSRRFPGRCTT